ncbi:MULTISPECIES: response regulator [unclassified Roseateles]|uniref:response regulator n=1 Tax=unclassified Roseateles TaxID=2626991 RepID=UPI0006F263E2|nr:MULTISPECIES: response regulator [unclassified Roseateles]KQW43289.1 hypothetical protein ASC81_15960 [Pelomonas sp. Root405]KRA71027.1 hypothetical protein ASD88_14485 [Pelomonas sp. Root662]
MASSVLRGLRVLVIDDNEDAAETVAWLLSDYGADTRTARDAMNIVDLVRHFKPDLVLLDLTLPVVDGFEACRRIRGCMGSKPYIAAVTGWGGEERGVQCTAAGFDLHLTKPVAVGKLVEAGQMALNRLGR